MFRRITIVGLGLMGGSLGLALKKRRIAREIIGIARRQSTLKEALRRGAIDWGSTRLSQESLQADLIVLAVPPLSVGEIAKKIARVSKGRLIVTDAASAKGQIVSTLERALPSRISFVGSHPMAGSERSGIEAARPDLFHPSACIITRTPKTSTQAIKKVSSLWRSVGGRVIVLSPREHDRLVAQISHLPHLTAVALTLAAQRKALPLAAGGFKDATRVALSDPDLWSEICMTNRREITKALDRFLAQLKGFRTLVATGKSNALSRKLLSAQKKRRMALDRTDHF